MRLRTPPSGPETTGTATNDVLTWDNTTKQWGPVPSTALPGPAFITALAVVVPALAAAGDTTAVNIPVAGAVAGKDMALVLSPSLAASGVAISGAGLSLAPNTIAVELIATKAYAGANEDFVVMLVKGA
jgi:hypothetical protein